MKNEMTIDLKNLSDKYPDFVFYAINRELKVCELFSKLK